MAHAEADSFRGLEYAQARKAVHHGTATLEEYHIFATHQIGHQAARINKADGGKNKPAAKVMLDEVREIGIGDWRCKACKKMNHNGVKGKVTCRHCNVDYNFVPSN